MNYGEQGKEQAGSATNVTERFRAPHFLRDRNQGSHPAPA